MADEVGDIEEESKSSGSSKIVMGLFALVVCLILIIVSMLTATKVTNNVINRKNQTNEVQFEEEKKTVKMVLVGADSKDKSFMVYIKKGEDQSSYSAQIRLNVGISNGALEAIISAPEFAAPLIDRILAYFSEKTRSDIIYSFQRKLLGEELKEIINAILERDMEVKEEQGRVTEVHVTKLLFMSL
ncbi:MAG: flagellar basal body-associated FliL family protein [Candidatus Cloacimonetes bacterium]|nr:flagellar basal body-associated FliL family protein [Candidatus Cloacimonadota bacterium]